LSEFLADTAKMDLHAVPVEPIAIFARKYKPALKALKLVAQKFTR
jgi:hypothetical protein